ncbi:class I SAM-dependent methyltransferase [Shouchella clausii]|jgi:ubiquinone/menaquinone biosynthesis C-methylase UbiE|uniref:SAM-dependent methyltransferase n=1 Tax=Shouchella clausii TaxID=79880 RepID=A0A268S5Y5_SHOCL|nr:class I SAM-dependent methyltransferase [Shouchella clausii]PAD44572.1 SAM-dependent methyltransferase [Bacillus sp. 7520-S]AST97446.1 SAM-dependent methyltransferase [Shouchella clausii]MBU8596544.1 methyltransferase domain-containing protein [Shouchella clausii]MCM3547100.1 methyltransferase domain-containing protein [Shouchella clausii]MCR1286352.1 methyltransferase domain-containing protein [Shouchella clausii]
MRRMEGAEFDQLVDFFDQMANTNWLSQLHSHLKQQSGSWQGKAIADIGCGTGRLLLRGSTEASKLIGVDLSAGMVTRANALFQEKGVAHKAKAVQGDAASLPLASGGFDIAFSTCVLFLLPDLHQGVKEMARILKPGGIAILLNPAPSMAMETAEAYAQRQQFLKEETDYLLKWATVSERRHRKSTAELSDILKKWGFADVRHEPVLEGLALISKAEKHPASP